MLDPYDRAAEERSSDKKSMASSDDERELDYKIICNEDTVYENSVSNDNVHTQDDDESVYSGTLMY